jgi:preprotein translocase subunit YajC
MKKVAIVSCYFQHNYGSQLQAYATQKILDLLKVENETVCIDGLKATINKRKYKFFLKLILDKDTVKEKCKTIKKAVIKKTNKEFGENISERAGYFKSFSREKFRLSERYDSFDELTAACKEKYSAVLVGSDQLWLPSNIYADYYTLNFVPDNINKISYATSFGAAKLPDWEKAQTISFLKRFNYISVREQSGQKLINELTGLDAKVVCDPTLLFDAEQWMDIQKVERIVEDKYIFCYFLGNNPLHREFANKLKEKTGYKIVALQHLDEYVKQDENFADIKPYNVGPGEFVNLIRNAEYVCTDSFHGSVFSTLYNKRFFTFMRFKSNSTMSTNSRITSLLKILGLEDRLVTGDENVEEYINKNIDYSQVNERLVHFRKDSLDFLKNALNG